ncbi:hypothetical protein L3X38_019106 [Prunus dulcis]|uniref:Uncharacterized protein n=1 Tax=Prunus dulcis TaxID=3755 RepID=A0AAD4ZBR8_PRUDU|nr:hypothetical protein L3X38_019106 [Prunus dulcis]
MASALRHFTQAKAWAGLAYGLAPCPGLPLPAGAVHELRPCPARAKGLELDRDLGEFVLLVEERSYRASQGGVFCRNPLKKDGRHVKSSRNDATTLLTKDATPLRKKPRIHSAEKTQVKAVLPPSARFKHLVGAYSKKIDGIRDVQDVPLESSTDKLGDRDLLHEVVCLPRSKEMLVTGPAPEFSKTGANPV